MSATYTWPDPLTATPPGTLSWPAPPPWLPAAHELVHTSAPLPPTSLPNAPTKLPVPVNSATRLLPKSATYTWPDPLTATPLGSLSWPASAPGVPDWHALVQT